VAAFRAAAGSIPKTKCSLTGISYCAIRHSFIASFALKAKMFHVKHLRLSFALKGEVSIAYPATEQRERGVPAAWNAECFT
jgi:hypothetical protein